MVLHQNDALAQSRGIMGPLANSAVQNNKGRLRQRFDLIRKLGQGTYGKVQLGIDKETGQEVAIKTIKKSKIETEADLIRIRREIQIMSSVRHPNIIHIYEVFENREKMVLVMEYAAGGELYDYLNDRKILQEDEARRIFRQIASAVYYCHKHKICHRDLKLENILLDEKANAKIADFGLSNVFDDINLLKTFCGSPLYASPEIVRGTPYYGPEVDCWSLGVLLYTLVYGAMPFDGSNFKRLVKQISNGDYYEPKKPAEASLLIRRMLTVDPLKRASIKDVCSHQWINQGFDTPCLANAEELANQTPVRLDLLLSVAPAYNINHSQVVIACDQNQDQSQMDIEIPSTSDAAAVAGAKPSTKIKQKDLASTSSKNAEHHHQQTHGGAVGGAVAPFDKPQRSKVPSHPQQSTVPVKPTAAGKEVSKKKPVVKKKSKSSPVLELIVDVEEEEPMEVIDGEDDDEDAGDTLSEISEIQTIAEDLKEVSSKPKAAKPSKDESKLAETKVKESDKDKKKVAPPPVTSTTSTPADKALKKKESVVEKGKESTENEKNLESAKPQKVTVTTKTATPATATTTEPAVVVPTLEGEKVKVVTKTAEKPNKEEVKVVTPKSVAQEKKVEATPVNDTAQIPKAKEEVKNKEKKSEEETKGKAVEPSSTEATGATAPAKPPTVVKKKLVKKVAKPTEEQQAALDKSKAALASSSSSVASSGGEKSGPKSEASPKAPKLRPRSDSNSSDASPTRIERRSSKIISQKTAELIQNLETKTSTSSTDSGKNKKLVFPSLKVSDAKRAFEKPPKPVNTIPVPQKPTTKTSVKSSELKPKESVDVVAKTEKEKPDKEKETTGTELVVKGKKPKSKSPSPCPDNEKISKKTKEEEGKDEKQTETKTVGKKAPNLQRKTEESVKGEQQQQDTPIPIDRKDSVKKSVGAEVPKVEEPSSELKIQPTPVKQKSTSPKPEKKIGSTNNATPTQPQQQQPMKVISPVPAAVKTPISPTPMSPEPDTETTQTVSDDLNTEIDVSMSEFSVSEVPTQTQPASVGGQKSTVQSSTTSKPIKKLKLKINSDTSEQLVKPVFVDTGHGPPRQAVMLMSGKTTPPVKSTHDLDSASISMGDPFFSQSESISMSLPKDKSTSAAPASKKAIPQNKEQAAKKISSVISRIASSESNERLMSEDKGKEVKTPTTPSTTPNKIIKTQVEKFVSALGDPGKVFKTQRSEVSFPVAAAQSQERIIPIKFAEDVVSPSTPPIQGGQTQANVLSSSSKTQSAPNIGVSTRIQSTAPKKTPDSSSTNIAFSRQNSSDTESSIAPPCKPEPIRKSPREFIIPIKIETSGQTVTPKETDVSEAGSNAEDPFRMDSRLRSGRFCGNRHKRYSSLLSDSSLEEEPGSMSAGSTSRRSSNASTAAPSHTRSHSLGDQPDPSEPTTPLGTFKRYRMRRAGAPLDRSDSFSSAEEDEEDAFEVLTAESLFTNLLDRVRNLTKRLNDGSGTNPNWPGPELPLSPGFGVWGTGSPFREFMSRAPSETRSYTSSGAPPGSGSYTMTRSFSREPSVTVTISTGPGRRSLSREISGDSDSASVGLESVSAASRSGSVFSPRGSFAGGGDNAETCTVRSLPVNLGSSRRSQFLSQRSEPRGISDKKIFGRSGSVCNGQDLLDSQSSSPLGLGSYTSQSSARPYGRTMSNSEFTTSVTLPFRRSLKSYDRPSGYNFQNDYSSPTSHTPSSSTGHSYLSNTGGATPHYSLPHRSNSVMSSSSSRYGSGSSSAGGSSVLGGGYGGSSGVVNSHYTSNLGSTPDSLYSNRYSRSLSRARATPDPDITPSSSSRFTKDMSVPRQLDNVDCVSSPGFNSGGPGSVNSNSTRSSGESNEWVGGATSLSVKTAAATAKMTTQEKMNNYQNYYQTLSQHPTNRLNVPESPALANYEDYNSNINGFHDDFMFRAKTNPPETNHIDQLSQFPDPQNSMDKSLITRRQPTTKTTAGTIGGHPGGQYPRYSGMYDGTGETGSTMGGHQSNVNNSFSNPYRYDRHISQDQRLPVGVPNSVLSPALRDLSSPTPLNDHYHSFSRETTPGFTNAMSNSMTSVPKCWPSNVVAKTQVHRPPNNIGGGSNFDSHPLPATIGLTSVQQQSPGQFTRLASPQPQQQQRQQMSSPPPTLENGENGLRSKQQSDGRAAEKITCFLQRKSMPRDLTSPPPMVGGGYQMKVTVIENKALHPNCDSPPPIMTGVSRQNSQQQLTNEEDCGGYVDRSYNSSPDKCKGSASGGGQKTNKPKFIQSLEKKWEKLTTGTSANNSTSNILKGNVSDSVTRKEKGVSSCSSSSAANSIETSGSREFVGGDDEDLQIGGKMVDSESSLLQRAVSPEKKPKSKFGSSTVNFMLGKFRRIEESSGGGSSSGTLPKTSPTGKPPSSGSNITGGPMVNGGNPSRIGRRVQSVYAGACSDSVLTLPSHLTSSRASPAPVPPPANGTCNGCDSSTPAKPPTQIVPSASQGLIRKTPSSVVSNQNQELFNGPEKSVKVSGSETECEGGEENKSKLQNKLRRPLSLGIFSNTVNPTNSSSSSFIPRFTRQNVAAAAAEAENSGTKFPENVITTTTSQTTTTNEGRGPSSPSPQINITLETKTFPSTDEANDGNPLTPTSISDSFDSSSVCSEKTEMSSRSMLDGEGGESVSERIHRKSFYPRFNSLDRKNRSSSVCSSSPRHYSPKPSATAMTTSGIGLSSKKMHRSSLSPGGHADCNSLNNGVGGGNFLGSSSGGGSKMSGMNDSESCSASKINKYNPNPLFKELITDEYKSDVGRKAEYSRRVTSKLSKLLREIESDNRSGIPKKETTSSTTSNLKSGQPLSNSSSGQSRPGSRARDLDRPNNSSQPRD